MTTLRILKKDKLFSFLNIASLSLGLFPCVLLLLLLQYEYSFDTFHNDSDRIYRIALDGYTKSGPYKTIYLSPKLVEAIQTEFPDAVEIFRFYHKAVPILMRGNDKVFNESDYLFADKNLISFFDIQLEEGNPETVLDNHHSMIVTREFAKKYFGDVDPIGKIINVDAWISAGSSNPWSGKTNPSGIDPAGDYVITGIVKELPSNSYIHFKCLLSMESIQWWDMWGSDLFNYSLTSTYVKLPDNSEMTAFESKLNSIVDKYHASAIEKNLEINYSQFLSEGKSLRYSLIPLQKLHFQAEGLNRNFEKIGDYNKVFYFIVISIIAVFIGCINFINLSTARSSTRFKEIGVRKVSGSSKINLIYQFLFESILLTSLSLILAIIIAAILISDFNSFLGTNINPANMILSWVFPSAIILSVLVGIIAGIYPAYIISIAKPAVIVKGYHNNPTRGKSFFRNTLVLFQYGISILFIMGALIVEEQLNFMHMKELGYDKEQVLVLQGSPRLVYLVKPTSAKYIELKRELIKIKGVMGISGTNPEIFGSKGLIHCFLRRVGANVNEKGTIYRLCWADRNVLENFKINVLTEISNPPSGESYYLTKSAVKALGMDNPIGEYLIRSWPYESGQWKQDLDTIMIAGTIEDIQYSSAQSLIEPVGMVLASEENMHRVPIAVLYVKMHGDDLAQTLSEIEATWKRLNPEYPFTYTFLDEKLDRFYDNEHKLGKLIGFFSLLSILISCLGILGLSAFLAQQKSKEISIRKIFGASVYQIMWILVNKHTRLIALAITLFIPITYLFAEKWLSLYPYRISINANTIIMSAGVILVITLISISWQLVKGITDSPLKILRTE